MNCCEQCALYAFDENEQAYFCEADFDEDEMTKIFETKQCPYFRLDDEYGVVRHQN